MTSSHRLPPRHGHHESAEAADTDAGTVTGTVTGTEAGTETGTDVDASGAPWWRSWRVGSPVVLALCGTLFIISANSSDGADLRPGRYTSLSALVDEEAQDYSRLQQRAAGLDDEVDTLSQQVQDRAVRAERRRAARLMDAAGLGDTRGSGVTVVLSDSPTEVLDAAVARSESEFRPYVVHQQDIQAVVNAMWLGGADAITLQGQRIITTTGIRCEGNAVQLQGVPYAQPYVISAVGDPGAMIDALDADIDVERFRIDADSPEVSVGWDLQVQDDVVAPAYDGLLDVTEAAPQEG